MRERPLLKGWYCRHPEEEAPGLPVSLPDDAMLREPRSADSPGGANIGFFACHDYLYTLDLELTEEEAGLHNVLEFEGVYRRSEVRINGRKAGGRDNGYLNFYADGDGLLHKGTNRIEVICRNSEQPNSRWYSGAGIYRPVRLWSSEEKHVLLNGIQIQTLSVSPARIRVDVQTSSDGPVEIRILDGERVVASVQGENRRFEMDLPEAEPWSPDHPRLYECHVRYCRDEASERFGLRTLEWGPKGLLLNGERIILRGACIHHDNGLLGAACHPDAVERRVRLLMENGYNAIRSAHNPCSKTALEICDRLGMLVMDEYVDMWYIHKTMHDYAENFEQNWRQDLTDMVTKDRNHPCVVMYSIGNEVAETAQKRGIELTGQMTEHLHALDETRPVTCGINIFFNFLNAIGFGQYSDEKAKKEADRNEQARKAGKKTKEKATGSKFFNDLAGLLGADFMKTGAALHGSDVTTRQAYAKLDIAGYNYGEKRYEKDLKKYPNRLILGSETFCSDAWRFWELAKQEPRILGDFVWAGMDYLGEIGLGVWQHEEYSPAYTDGVGWLNNLSGRIDLTGKPVGEALYTRVAFELESGPRLSVKPMFRTGKLPPSAWKMTYALPSWSWQGCEGMPADIEVYARCEKIELKLNGKTVGVQKKPKKNCVFRFSIPYAPGTLEAIAYDAQGQICGRDELRSASGETELRLEPEADIVERGHLAFVRLRLTDPEGITKSREHARIQIQVEGGRLLTCGSACPYEPDSYLSPVCRTFFGEALAVLEVQDNVKMRAVYDGGSAEAEIRVRAGT